MTSSLREKLNFLYALRRDYNTDTTFRPPYIDLLEKFENPHHHLPPVIHVAGTNGKGSTIAFMRAILQAAGYRVHTYTSPHLLRPNERIVLAGEEISDALLEFVIDEGLRRCPNPGQPDMSFFEFFTACAFATFAHTPGDVLLLETGLGGRLDSTNVVRFPVLNIITTLSYDHTETLGRDIADIAAEKAGIMKADAPCVIGHQIHAAVFDTLIQKAAATGIDVYAEDKGWTCHGNGKDTPFCVATPCRTLDCLPAPQLLGAHQLTNAATAVAALMVQQRFEISDSAFATGLKSAVWPARLQKIDTHMLPAGWELWLDGGHNDSAALVLADQARAWQEEDGKPLHIITAMMGHKDAVAFAAPLASLVTSVTSIVVPEQKDHTIPPDILARVWQDAGARIAQDISSQPLPELLQSLSSKAPAGRVLITGSLHLAQMVGF